jgi:Tfp pilus assembly protein PilX
VKRRMSARDDSGAALIVALVIVVVFALGLSALLSFSDTSIRTTVALRNQASDAYDADGAAQVAINQLRKDNFNGVAGGCNTATTAVLPNFYPATNTAAAASAAVRCTPDPTYSNGGGGGGANSSPGSAILTLGNGTAGEYGLYYNSSNNASFKVKGGVFSDSTIFLQGNKSNLENTATGSYVYAMGTCSSDGSSKIISTPAAVCNYSSNPVSANDRRGMDPGTIPTHGASFDPPAAPTAAGTVLPVTCTSQTVYEFQPGVYRSAAALNALTASAGACSGSVWHFNPGTYFFDFTDVAIAHRWTVNSGFLVGGTPTASPFTVAKVAAETGPYCIAPVTGGTNYGQGVKFVFGGDSRMEVKKGGASANPNVHICASNSSSGPPIALYGLKTGIGSGAFAIAGQTGCITQLGYVFGGDTTHCAVLQTYNDPSPGLTIYGTTYTPKSIIDLYLNNNTTQVFRWGLVTRGFYSGSTGSSDLSNAIIAVPDDAPAPFALPNLMYLDVYVCPNSGTCDASGQVRLRVKVLVSPVTPRTVSVLSWAVQR